jgi:hypothetical protein
MVSRWNSPLAKSGDASKRPQLRIDRLRVQQSSTFVAKILLSRRLGRTPVLFSPRSNLYLHKKVALSADAD